MKNRWVVISDELRMCKADSYETLIGEDINMLKGGGTFEVDPKKKIIIFSSDQDEIKLCPLSDLKDIKVRGFFSPLIRKYKWSYSIPTVKTVSF